MVGTAKSGRKRVLIPTGDDAVAELRKIRRQERRRERHARKKAEENGEVFEDELDTSPPPPVDFNMEQLSSESLKKMFAEAFAELGGVAGLVAWGRRYPKEFYPMWAKWCLPKDGGGSDDPGTGLEAMLSQLDKRSAKEIN